MMDMCKIFLSLFSGKATDQAKILNLSFFQPGFWCEILTFKAVKLTVLPTGYFSNLRSLSARFIIFICKLYICTSTSLIYKEKFNIKNM